MNTSTKYERKKKITMNDHEQRKKAMQEEGENERIHNTEHTIVLIYFSCLHLQNKSCML